MIVGYIHRFNLSEVAKKSLIEMIHILLPISNKIPKTENKILYYLFKKKFIININAYCSSCMSLLIDDKCLNKNCNLFKEKIAKPDTFIQ